jgi:hypothetical protein
MVFSLHKSAFDALPSQGGTGINELVRLRNSPALNRQARRKKSLGCAVLRTAEAFIAFAYYASRVADEKNLP